MNYDDDYRRCKLVGIDLRWLLELFREIPRYRVVLPSLPDDYEIHAVVAEPLQQAISIIVWSASWPTTPVGMIYPYLGEARIEPLIPPPAVAEPTS